MTLRDKRAQSGGKITPRDKKAYIIGGENFDDARNEACAK
jgi:hypothetical protein